MKIVEVLRETILKDEYGVPWVSVYFRTEDDYRGSSICRHCEFYDEVEENCTFERDINSLYRASDNREFDCSVVDFLGTVYERPEEKSGYAVMRYSEYIKLATPLTKLKEFYTPSILEVSQEQLEWIDKLLR